MPVEGESKKQMKKGGERDDVREDGLLWETNDGQTSAHGGQLDRVRAVVRLAQTPRTRSWAVKVGVKGESTQARRKDEHCRRGGRRRLGDLRMQRARRDFGDVEEYERRATARGYKPSRGPVYEQERLTGQPGGTSLRSRVRQVSLTSGQPSTTLSRFLICPTAE